MAAKCAIQTAKPEIVQATESLKGFAGQKSGREAAVQAMSKIFLCRSGDRHMRLRLQLHGAIYRPDSFVLMLRYCANLKAIRYESTSLNRIVADKSHRVIVA